MPEWLSVVAAVWLVLSAGCALVIISDLLAGHGQHMWIMNIVWPTTALYAGPLALWLYYRVGRQLSRRAMQHRQKSEPHPAEDRPFWLTAAVATTHCGGGCTLGDILVEGVLLSLFPLTLFGRPIFAAWIVDFIAAFGFGIAFQYFTIKPMRNLSSWQGLVAAVKADALSLTAWQIGMYGWMALVTFVFVGHELPKGRPMFWFMMQIAMVAGFLTSYPVNCWLLRSGIKEKM